MRIESSKGSVSNKSGNQKVPLPAVDDRFHVSIAWTLESPDQNMLDLTQENSKIGLGEVRTLHIDVKGMKVKIGNVVTNVELPEKVKVEKSMIV